MNKHTIRVYLHSQRVDRWLFRTTAPTAERALQKAINYREPPEQWALFMSGDHPVDIHGNPAEMSPQELAQRAPIVHRGVHMSQAVRDELDAYYARKGGRNVSVRLSPTEQAFLAAYGDGSFSQGLRRLIQEARLAESAPDGLSALI